MTDTPNGGYTPPGGYAAYLTGRLESLGLSRNALARALGHRGASQVSRWCAGKAVPREKARAKIEAALTAWETAFRAGYSIPTRLSVVSRMLSQTSQDAPGGPISGGEAPEGTRGTQGEYMRILTDGSRDVTVVERYVVEGG